MLRTAWRSLRHHKLRLVLSGVAIVLGVGFVVGTLIFTDTLNKTFTDLFADVTADVVVTPKQDVPSGGIAGSVATLPSSMLDTVRGVDGVAKADGGVFADGVAIIGGDDKPLGTPGAPQFGSNWVDDEQLTAFRLIDGRGPQHAGEVVIDSVSADKGGYSVGDTVPLVTPKGSEDAELVGIFRYGTSGNLAGATIAAFDTATAQRLLLNGADAFVEIDAIAEAGVSQSTLAGRVKQAVGPEVKVQTGQEAADQAAADLTAGLSFINIFLLVFAGIALFVGTFIILNTFSMLVAQRARELALLRAVGATRGQVVRSVLAESFLVGLLGSVVGLLVGIGVAFALQGLFKAIGAEIPTTGLVVQPRTVVVGIVIGVAVTVLAALPPALRASRIPPMAALRADVALAPRSLRVRAVSGAVLLVLGLVAMTLGVARGGSAGSAWVGIGTVVTLVGAIVLSPAIAAPVVRLLGFAFPRLFGTVGRLAVDNARRQPRRTAATASALMIGLALVSALTVFATSAKTSVNQVVDRVIGAEFVVTNASFRPFPPEVAEAIRTTEGVASVAPVKQAPAQVDGQSVFVTGVEPALEAGMVTVEFVVGSMADLGPGQVLVDTTTAERAGLSPGDQVRMVFPTGKQTLQVVGLYQPAGSFSGYVVANDTLAAAGLALGDSLVYVKADDGADLDAVQAGIESALAVFPTVQVQSQAQFKEEISSNVDQLLMVMIMLLSLAILIAVLGIVNTLVLSVIERTREIGLLRAVGALRKQVRRMVLLEALVIAVYGAVIGLVLGVGFAVALQRTLVEQGIEVLDIPWGGLMTFLVLAGVVGVLAAVWPAYRAGRLDVLRAVTTE